ncbi:hypothetical protein ACNUDN_11875 [Mycobacterium sp. smrl_JER01]|uniref:hypothetical protein n=1 Tax=Mycobacterium sp. smrl_JER01 TaxID=3402633 RepID=UPI003AC54AAA
MSQINARDVSTVRTIALICDPEAAPAEIAGHLFRVLPALLAEATKGAVTVDVRLHRERLPIGPEGDHQTLIEHAERITRQRGWDASVCVTDLPLRGEGNEPLVADLSIESSVAVLSLPAFGATRLRRRVTEVVVEILQELVPVVSRRAPTNQPSLSLTDRDLPGPFRLVVPETSGIDAQVVATRGLWRQLVGMVRANRPWRLWLGLRGGVVAALAFSIFWLINPMVWQLGINHSVYRLIIISLWVVAAMVTWLIFYHHLWVFRDDDIADRQHVVLFNASTVITLVLGVSIAFVGLLMLNFLAAHLVLSDKVMADNLGSSPGLTEYIKLCWMATAGASVVGALGTGFESEDDVREAAYSQREAERRKQWRGGRNTESEATSGGRHTGS